MICSSLNLDRFIVRLPYHDGLYTNLEEFQGLRSKHVYRLNPDGSLGSEIPEERATNEPIVRDIQLDVLMSVQAAEGLKNWLDQYIKNLKSRTGNPVGEVKASPGIAPLSAEIARVGAAR
jgi:hypothetical protein